MLRLFSLAALALCPLLHAHAAAASVPIERYAMPYQNVQAYPFTDAQGFVGTRILWSAGASGRRSVHLIDSTQKDPLGTWGGYARTMTYNYNGQQRICQGTSPDYPGFGSVVNHFAGTSSNSVRHTGTNAGLIFADAGHALYGYDWQYKINNKPVVIHVHWLFVTGQAAPIYAITYDLSHVPANAVRADTRAPYGEIDWDGGAKADVDGIAWGDDKRFETLQSPVTMQTGWDYTADNDVPFVRAFSRRVDAEMGLVQTQTQAQHSAGGYWGYGAWGSQNASGPMPEASNWPFQMHQYQLPGNKAAKRLAWGSNYGAVGQMAYPLIGDSQTAMGYPYQSYSVYVVLEPHTQDPVMTQVDAVANLQHGKLCAGDNAEVVVSGPGGVGRTDTVDYDVPGLSPVFNTWELQQQCTGHDVSFSLTAPDAIQTPTFVLHGDARAPKGVLVNGKRARANADYMVSQDPDNGRLWLTLLNNSAACLAVVLTF